MTPIDPSALKFWESVGEWGFIFVWVGVAGEGIEISIKLFCPKLYDKKKSCLDLIGAIFWLVLVAALAVEFWGNHKAMQLADSMNSQLNTEAAQARKDAAEANERAALVESNNLALRSGLRDFVLDQTEAREIDSYDLATALKQIPDVKVILLVDSSDHEARGFSSQLQLAFVGAGWEVKHMAQRRIAEGCEVFISFVHHGMDWSKSSWDACLLLDRELRSRGISTDTVLNQEYFGIAAEELPTNAIIVSVAPKLPRLKNREMLDRSIALLGQGPNADPVSVSNAWRQVCIDEEAERQQNINLGIWATNAPHPGFSPRGYSGDGSPIVPEIPVQ